MATYAGIDGSITIYTESWYMKLPFKSESINPKYRTTVTSDAVTGKRGKLGLFINGRAYEGSIDLEAFDMTDDSEAPTYKHVLLGLLFYLALGKYDSTEEKVSLGTSAPSISAIKIDHGDSTNGVIYYKDAYVTGFSYRAPADGVPTITLDIRAKSMDTTYTPTATIDLNYVDFKSFYRPSDYAVKLGSTPITTSITNLELSTSMDTLEGSAGFGNPVDLPIAPGLMDAWDITMEFNVSNLKDINSWASLKTALTSGTQSTENITLEIDSPMETGNKAILTITKPFVTEFNHDMSSTDFLRGKLALKAPADGIELTGVLIA